MQCFLKKRLWMMVLAAILIKFASHGAAAKESRVSSVKPKSRIPVAQKKTSPEPIPNEDELRKEMKKYLGVPYRRGGTTSKGMDCSGFVKRVFAGAFGIELPHNASSQYALPFLEKAPSRDLQTGDLVFFAQKKKYITHVGVYLSDGKFVHAGRRSGVTISSLNEQYWKTKLIGAKRLSIMNAPDTMIARSSAGIEIALDDMNTVRFQYARTEPGLFPMREERFRTLFGPDARMELAGEEDVGHHFAVEYNRHLGDDLLGFRVSALRETYQAGGEDHIPRLIWPKSPAAFDPVKSGHRRGIRMASDFNPVQWLRITPSFTIFDYEEQVEEFDPVRRTLGIETQMASLDRRWSLSLALQYYDEEDRSVRLLDDADSWNAVDLSFVVGYRLTDDMKLSIMGQRAVKEFPGLGSDLREDRREYRDVVFTLDLSF